MQILTFRRSSILMVSLILSVVSLTVFLSGCVTTNPVIPTRYYLLNPVEYENLIDNKEIPASSISIEIAALRLPLYLEKPQIVRRSTTNRLEMAEYHQWGGSLRKNMTRVLAQTLSRLLDTPQIAIAPYRPPVPPDFRLSVEVMQFEANQNGTVQFSALWRLSNGRDNQVLKTRIVNLEHPKRIRKDDFDGLVSTMGSLLGDFSQTIAHQIINHTTRSQPLAQ